MIKKLNMKLLNMEHIVTFYLKRKRNKMLFTIFATIFCNILPKLRQNMRKLCLMHKTSLQWHKRPKLQLDVSFLFGLCLHCALHALWTVQSIWIQVQWLNAEYSETRNLKHTHTHRHSYWHNDDDSFILRLLIYQLSL